MDNPHSNVSRVKLAGSRASGASPRETVTTLATVDDLICYRTKEGGLILEFVRWDKNQKPVESYRITACPEDCERISRNLTKG